MSNRERQLDPARPSVADAIPLARAVYAGHGAGCCLHIVLDDGNYSDGIVEEVAQWAQQRGHAQCVALANMLVKMSKTQRAKLARKIWEK